jgi:bifunctional non-homologous end joining protein LigD
VLKSWAVPEGPSLVPGEKRLAVQTEDHPLQYGAFEGVIPKGEYGGGTVMIWDRGTWTPETDPDRGYKKGHLKFRLDGKKLKGVWHLVRMARKPREKQERWLLFKSDDEAARSPSEPDIVEEMPLSAATGRSMDEVARDQDRIWSSSEGEITPKTPRRKKPGVHPKNLPNAFVHCGGSSNFCPQMASASGLDGAPRAAVRQPEKLHGGRPAGPPGFVRQALPTFGAVVLPSALDAP